MKRNKSTLKDRIAFYLILVLILAIVGYVINGMYTMKENYMRFGIDIKGGISATFIPDPKSIADPSSITDEQLDAAKLALEKRLDQNNIFDRTVTINREDRRILVEFPWQAGEKDFDPVASIDELGKTNQLTFLVLETVTEATDDTLSYQNENFKIVKQVMDGSVIKEAFATLEPQYNRPSVSLSFDSKGAEIFPAETDPGDLIGILYNDELISVAEIQNEITDGQSIITGNFTEESATKLAQEITSGALPFTMKATDYSSVSATMGTNALSIMILAGLIALAIIFIFMCAYYRLTGFVASLVLLLQTAGQLLIFHQLNLTLTLPGIAGIILSIGMGVDSNIIIAERIKEEINAGKTLAGSITAGYNRAFSAVLDCNITTAAIGVLLAIFGTGAMLSFAYTLLIGIFMNFGVSIISSKLMLQSLAKHKIFSNPVLYGYKNKKEGFENA
jgi:protein-export membrane protein SecD